MALIRTAYAAAESEITGYYDGTDGWCAVSNVFLKSCEDYLLVPPVLYVSMTHVDVGEVHPSEEGLKIIHVLS